MTFFSFLKPHQTTEPEPVPVAADPVLMRFLTVGGATVELQRHCFTTRYTWQGRPYVGDPRQVDGFVWKCLGCGADGKGHISSWDGDYLPDERNEARGHANAHAHECRAMPRAEVPR
jgi:hypothetical protein